MTTDEIRRGVILRLELERAGLTTPSQQQQMIADLSRQLGEAHDGITDALIRQEELTEHATYWRQRAVHAERQLTGRQRLHLVGSDDSA